MGRRLAVRVLAFALRRGVTVGQLAAVIDRCFPHRTHYWRDQLWLDARARNEARA